ncbi:COMM domain-containing protein 5 [Centruroides vittatus]|uniref:COMM domain-containing protein 5 n=1 Tax=Centruroides vittatus TaxID=120091 RepID=UPI003510C310
MSLVLIKMAASLSGSGSGERYLTFDPKTSNEIKDFCRLLNTVDKQTFRALIKLAVLDFEGKPIPEDSYQSVKQLAKNSDHIDVIYHGLYTLLNFILRFPEHVLKPEILKEDLKELRIPDEFVDDLFNVIYGSRRIAIDAGRLKQGPSLPILKSLRWRVDVTISNSVLSRVLEPSVLMELISDKDAKYTFEVHPLKFQQLRFSVAALLKEMQDLEKRNVLKMNI